MSENISVDDVFSSFLVKQSSKDMGAVERFILGLTDDSEVALKVTEFINRHQESGAQHQHGTAWFSAMRETLKDITSGLTMEGLAEFFAVLEKITQEDSFEEFFQDGGLNQERFSFLKRVATVNMMFAPAFNERLGISIEMSKDWWEEK